VINVEKIHQVLLNKNQNTKYIVKVVIEIICLNKKIIMKNLDYYKEIIKKRRKQTNFKDYLKEIVSHFPMTYYKNS